MRAAMAEAEVGDDVYGEDPTVRALEERVAEPARPRGRRCSPRPARWPTSSPSGRWSARRGGALRVRGAHRPGRARRRRRRSPASPCAPGAADAAGRPGRDRASCSRPTWGRTSCRPRRSSVENTHNFGGGTVQPLEDMRAVARLADERGIGVHLDGARLWNAHVATGVPLRELRRLADTVSVCLSKGLGAPVGSLRRGRRRARSPRRGSGASGSAAACGRSASSPRPGCYALDHHVDRLADDHARARLLRRRRCGRRPRRGATPTSSCVDVPRRARGGRRGAGARRAGRPLGPRALRLVTHLDVDDAGTERRSTPRAPCSARARPETSDALSRC